MRVQIILLAAILLPVLALKAQNIPRKVPGNIESYIDRFELRSSDKHGNGWSHYYIPRDMGDTLTVKMSCVYIGTQTHPPHTHHEDEAFYIIQGPVNFHINGVERILNTGDFVYTPSGSSHNIQRVNETDTIKYLVLKRETVGQVKIPHPVAKADYTFDDCSYHAADNRSWAKGKDAAVLLLDKRFADGFQVVLNRATKDKKVYQNKKQGSQAAIYLIEGTADITLDGMKAEIGTDNTLYCPKGSTYTLKKKGDEPLLFLTVTTR